MRCLALLLGLLLTTVSYAQIFQLSDTRAMSPLMGNQEVRLDLTQVTRVNAFGFKQAFSNNTLELSRSIQRVEKPFTFISETQTDRFGLGLNFHNTLVNAAFESTQFTDSKNTTDLNTVNINLTRDRYSVSYLTQKGTLNDIGNLNAKTIGVAMPFLGGDAKFVSGFADKLENWTPVHETQRELFLPFNSLIKGAAYKTASSSRLVNGVLTAATDSEEYTLPLDLLWKGAFYQHGNAMQLASGVKTESETNIYKIPLDRIIKGMSYAYANSDVLTNGVQTGKNLTEQYVIPLDRLIKGASYSFNDTQVMEKGVFTNYNTSKQYLVPLDRFLKGASYSRLDQTILENKVLVDRFQEGLSFPMNLLAKGSTIAYHNNEYRLHGNTNWADSTDVTITSPLQLFGIPLDSVYTYVLEDPSGLSGSRFSTQLKVPTRAWGKLITNTHSVAINTLGQDTIQSNFAIPFKRGNLALGRTYIDTAGASNTTYTMETPQVELLSNLTSQANFAFYMPDNTANLQKRAFNLVWAPSKKATTTMSWINSELNPAEHYNMNFATGYNISENRKLNFGYFEKEMADNTFSIQKQAVFTQAGNMTLNASLLQMENNGAVTSPLANWDVSYGDIKNLSLAAMYQRYDPAKTIQWIEPTMGIEMKHDGGTIDMAYKYQGSAGRLLPLNVVDSIIKLSDNTNLQLTYTNNGIDPLDAKQQLIRIGHTYEAALRGKLGSFNILTAIRNYNADSSWSFSLGDNNGSGQFSLIYQAGDFSPLILGGVRTENIFGLQYEKVFRENERLSFKYNSYQLYGTNAEGRLEFNMTF